MPPARRSSTTKSTARSTKPAARSASGSTARATGAVRARAASTRAATRREVEQSITRFEKRLDDANDALQTLGTHLGRGAQSSYKEVTAAMRALRRDAVKTNKQALKDFDKLRSALTPSKASSRGGSRSTSAGSTTSSASGTRAASSRSTSSRKTASRKTAKKS